MAYISVDDVKNSLLDVKKLVEAGRLSDGDIERWVDVTEGEIDSYCSSRYRLPFTNQTSGAVETPPLIRSLTKQLTTYYFLEDQNRAPDTRDRIHSRVLAVLRRIQSGEQKVLDTDKNPIALDSTLVDDVYSNRMGVAMVSSMRDAEEQNLRPQDYED